ncbi:2-dehydropantoate 2-reductase-like protein [Pleomassaria siparia CBS 279.74]|uniref:2-dehydropantoate 2-reductase n=1 Tax=Pleomassaria siparia CBS 279.74 TaxID=1314801 RepID=A0A6G1K009_9PLEO|nr:2-dehydropantoate 2-reductase-like protein [Pleomassaria siparia CBS 279.74]
MPPPPIHILGLGNLGKLLAHSLRKYHPELPITLLFHRPSLAEEWERAGRCIEIVRNGKSDKQGGFAWENVRKEKSEIKNLLVATKTYGTAQAVTPLKERLGKESTLLFIQNGMGTIDEVTSQVFTSPSTRPNYLAGVVSHGVYATSQFSSVHAGLANAVIGPVVTDSHNQTSIISGSPSSYMAQKIVGCPVLSTSLLSSQDLLHAQLTKLTINATNNPLTVLFDCINGALLQSPRICTLIDRIISEVSAVIHAMLSNPPQGPMPVDPGLVHTLFSPESLRKTVHEVITINANNISSMRQDVLAGRKTEIDYINGWIVKKGQSLGVTCPINKRVVQLVKEGRKLNDTQIDEAFNM